MKTLSVTMQMVDNISNKLGSIASSGRTIEASFQNIENSANRSFQNIESGSDAISQSFERTSASASSLASSVGTYGGQAANAVSSANSLASSNSNAETSFNEAASAAEDVAEELAGLGEQAEQAGNSAEEFGNKSSGAMNDLNSLLVSGGIVAALHEVAEGFAECATNAEVVETSVAQLQTIAGGGSIGFLSEELMELSNDTGQAAEGLADTAYNAISAGTAAEESVEAASQANQLAVAGFTDTTSALSVLETATNSYGEAAGGMEHISDSLITVQNLGVTTVRDLAAQMGKAISTASAYNVSLENLESGYISVTKAGINTAEGTTYLSSMLNELGNSGSEISRLLKDETGNTFGELMKEGKSLADVLGLVYDACDNNAEAMMNMWGSAEAGKAANAIIGQGLDTFNDNLTTLREDAGTTAEAYAVMADTTKYAHDKMDNAAKNTSVQIGEVLNPALTKVYGEIENLATGIGKFVKENPEAVKAIAVLSGGITVFAGGIAAYTAATTIATTVQTAFNGAMLANPAFQLIGAFAVLTTSVGLLTTLYGDATDASNELTYASAEHADKLSELKKEYEEVTVAGGAESKKAIELASQIGELERSYGNAEETIGGFQNRIDSLGESIQNIQKTYDENISSVDSMYGSSIMLISQLSALQEQTTLTDTELKIMKGIVGELNGSYSDLGLTIDEQSGKMNFSTEDLFDYAKAFADQQKMEAASKGLVEALGKYGETKTAYEEAFAEVDKRQEDYTKSWASWRESHPVQAQVEDYTKFTMNTDVKKKENAYGASQSQYKEASDSWRELNEEIEEYCMQLGYSEEETNKFMDQLDGTSEMAEQAAVKFGTSGEEIASYEDAVSGAVQTSREELTEYAEAYKNAYKAAEESIEGQYSLWDKIGKKVLEAKTSVEKIGKALDSQTQYWENYSKNMDNLRGRDVNGLDDVLKNMDDGSEESAAALAGMARASDKELEKIVEKYEKLQKVQGKTAGKVADLESEFALKCSEMSEALRESVEKMDMEHDAEAAAKKTIQAYINAIRSGVGGAQSAADAVAKAAAKALKTPEHKKPQIPEISSGRTSFPTMKEILSYKGYASGTTDSEQVYVAGEEGPELILSGGGDTVFPTSETDRIISAVSKNDNRQMTEPSAMRTPDAKKGTGNAESSGGDRTLTLRLEGSGTISVGSGNKEEIWNGTKGKIKSAFMQILQEEVFEEGAGAYEF